VIIINNPSGYIFVKAGKYFKLFLIFCLKGRGEKPRKEIEWRHKKRRKIFFYRCAFLNVITISGGYENLLPFSSNQAGVCIPKSLAQMLTRQEIQLKPPKNWIFLPTSSSMFY